MLHPNVSKTALRLRDRPDALFKEEMMKRMVRATKDIKLETSRRVSAEKQVRIKMSSIPSRCVHVMQLLTKMQQPVMQLVMNRPALSSRARVLHL